MKVAINAIPIRPGGGLTVVLGLLRGLHEADPRLDLSVLASASETLHAVRESGCPARLLPVLDKAGATSAFVWQNRALGRLLREQHMDVLLTINHHLRHIACHQVVYHLNLRRFVRTHRSANPWVVLQEYIRDRAARRALQRASANVFESRFLEEAAQNSIAGPVRNPRVIYAGIADDLIAASDRVESRSAEGSRRIVAITSPLPHKDNPTLVRMLADLVQREPDAGWQLDVAGGTDLQAWEPVRALARSLGVENCITWHGFCSQHALTALLRQSLCLVSTSLLESFAMVATEAMARGCPPIVADCAAMPESVGDAGLLATPGNAESFADAVRSLVQVPGRRSQLVAHGRSRIQKLRWSQCGRAFHELFAELTTAAESATRPAGKDVQNRAA